MHTTLLQSANDLKNSYEKQSMQRLIQMGLSNEGKTGYVHIEVVNYYPRYQNLRKCTSYLLCIR
jgi:hypothetical protein